MQPGAIRKFKGLRPRLGVADGCIRELVAHCGYGYEWCCGYKPKMYPQSGAAGIGCQRMITAENSGKIIVKSALNE